MQRLERLYRRLGGDNLVYLKDGEYITVERNKVLTLYPSELLKFSRQSPIECVIVACFNDEIPTRIIYAGENAISMKKTIESLRIPRFPPENLGELVFYIFRQEINGFNKEMPVSLEQLVKPGKEEQFFLVLKKLLHVYSGKKIDSDFYGAVKQQPRICSF